MLSVKAMNRSVPLEEIQHHSVRIPDSEDRIFLDGILSVPPAPLGWVIFAHGSGSSRFSPRNLQVAQALQQEHWATLLFDLLTQDESEDRRKVFDIPLLTRRLVLAVQFLKQRPEYNAKPIALFGASTGAAAAMEASADLGSAIRFLISRGGRVDLARDSAHRVKAQTLLIVGSRDEPVLSWNRETLPLLERGELKVISGASHLFEEPHALSSVIQTVTNFLTKCLKPSHPKTTLHP